MTPDIDGGEKALDTAVEVWFANRNVGDENFRDRMRWAIAAYHAAHPAPSTGNEGGADEIERINRESMQKREADLLRRGGADYEAKAREILRKVAFDDRDLDFVAAALSQARLAAAQEMRDRCEAVARNRWPGREIADALAALPLSPEKGSGG